MASTSPTMTMDDDSRNIGILKKISVLRELLMIHPDANKSEGFVSKMQTSALQQERYEEKRRLEGEARKQQQLIHELQEKIEEMGKELEKERSNRKKLEDSYESLAEYRKGLSNQLEQVSKTRDSLEAKRTAAESALDKAKREYEQDKNRLEKQLQDSIQQRDEALKEVGSHEASLLAAKRLAEELKAEKIALEEQNEKDRARNHDVVQGYVEKIASLKCRLEESEADHKATSSEQGQESTTVNQADANVELLKKKVEELEEKLVVAEKKLQDSKTESEKSQSDLEQRLREAKAQLDATREESQCCKSRIAELTEATETLKRGIGDSESTTVKEEPSDNAEPNPKRSKNS